MIFIYGYHSINTYKMLWKMIEIYEQTKYSIRMGLR